MIKSMFKCLQIECGVAGRNIDVRCFIASSSLKGGKKSLQLSPQTPKHPGPGLGKRPGKAKHVAMGDREHRIGTKFYTHIDYNYVEGTSE